MSAQKFDHKADRRLYTGVSGTGKTTLWMDQVRDHEARFKFIYDHQGEYAERSNKRKICASVDLLIEAIEDRQEVIVFDPIQDFPGQAGKGFACLCDLVFQMSKEGDLNGTKLIACDELQLVTDRRIEPIEFLTLCETGRRYQIDALFTSQAPNRLHNAIRDQVTEVFAFRLTDSNALDWLKDQGFDPDQVRAQADYKYQWKNLRTGKNNFGAGKGKEGTRLIQSDTVPAPELSGNPETAKPIDDGQNAATATTKAAGN